MRNFDCVLVTGGAGFIGSNFIRYLLTSDDAHFSGKVINLDALTYAGNLESLEDVQQQFGGTRYFFEKADICDRQAVEHIFEHYAIDAVVHFAAESHVDRSILDPSAFVRTNVMGTFVMLDVAKEAWRTTGGGYSDGVLFHHVSTDEVYGSLGETGLFTEETPYAPRSPYSASKAASDHLVMSYFHTYGLPLTLSNCSNNYGPYQFPEKLLPLMITNIQGGKPLPVYGAGRNVRDWIYVEDHNRAVWCVMRQGVQGQKYNIGGENELANIDMVKKTIQVTAAKIGKNAYDVEKTITFVKDRPGHDLRYAIDCSKIKRELGWRRCVTFGEGLEHTVSWYLDHPDWVDHILSGEYSKWIEKNYSLR